MFVRHPPGWIRPERRRLGPTARERLHRRACLEILASLPPGGALDRALDRHQSAHPGSECATRLAITPDASHYLLAHGDAQRTFSFEQVELHHAGVEIAAFRFLERAHREVRARD